MSDTRVCIKGHSGKPDNVLLIRVNGPDPTFRIATEQISNRLLAPVDGLLLDLLDVVASVFATDSSVPRGSTLRAGFGSAWRRKLNFSIPVRKPETWSDPILKQALVDAVTFLTDDDVTMSFIPGRAYIGQQQYLDFDPNSDPALNVEDVILFSGGLDSLAGAVERLSTTTGRVALVTHQSAQKIIPHQNRLAGELARRFPGRILYVPVRATRVGKAASETTQRSRSLLFAAFGFVIARMLGSRRVSFYENGIVSQNLPISPQVIGTMATRTTHPETLRRLNSFLNRLAGPPITIENHYAWLTKSEVIAKIAEHGCADLIRDTVSCTKVRGRDTVHTHCGACSQCLDRRFAMLAAGLDAQDPEEMYETEVLYGQRLDDYDRIMALDWTRHACNLDDMPFRQFAGRFAGELARIASGYPNVPAIESAKTSFALQQRHGKCVATVMEAALRRNSKGILTQSLPETSLLRSYVAITASGPQLPSLTPPAQLVGGDDKRDHLVCATETPAPILPLQVAFTKDGRNTKIVVIGLGDVVGAPARVAHGLKVAFDEDIASGCRREDHRYIPAGMIPAVRTPSKSAVRKNVQRCRATLADFYRAIEGSNPPRPLLIENRGHSGYRLDPTCKIVAAD